MGQIVSKGQEPQMTPLGTVTQSMCQKWAILGHFALKAETYQGYPKLISTNITWADIKLSYGMKLG